MDNSIEQINKSLLIFDCFNYCLLLSNGSIQSYEIGGRKLKCPDSQVQNSYKNIEMINDSKEIMGRFHNRIITYN